MKKFQIDVENIDILRVYIHDGDLELCRICESHSVKDSHNCCCCGVAFKFADSNAAILYTLEKLNSMKRQYLTKVIEELL